MLANFEMVTTIDHLIETGLFLFCSEYLALLGSHFVITVHIKFNFT